MPTATLEKPQSVQAKTEYSFTEKLEKIKAQEKTTVRAKLTEIEKLVLTDKSLQHLEPTDSFESRYSLLYASNVTPYSIELVALYYKLNKEKTAYELDRFYEFTYNLRDNISTIVKNFKELRFSENNICNIFAGYDTGSVLTWFDTLQNTDMFSTLYGVLGRLGAEQRVRIDRFLIRLRLLRHVELIYKSGVPTDFARNFARSYAQNLRTDYSGRPYLIKRPILNGRAVGDATSPRELLSVTKSCFKLICLGVYTWQDYVRIIDCIHRNVHIVDKPLEQKLAQTFTQLLNLYHYALELDDKYGLNKAETVVRLETETMIRQTANGDNDQINNRHSIGALAKFTNSNFYRMVEYAYYQLEVEQGNSQYDGTYVNTLYRTTYGDYLHMALDLGVRRDIFPKYLVTQHDILARNKRTLQNEQLQEEVAVHRERWNAWAEIKVRGSKYAMFAPENLQDLTVEATQMGNCVASYANSVAKGRTNIMFLREKTMPDVSVVTVEIRDNKLVQAYQRFNHKINTSQAEFLVKWCNRAGIELGERVPVSTGERI